MSENESEPVRRPQRAGGERLFVRRDEAAHASSAYRAFAAGDIDAIMRDWGANARFFLSGEYILRWGGLHSGTAEIRDAFTKMNPGLEGGFFHSPHHVLRRQRRALVRDLPLRVPAERTPLLWVLPARPSFQRGPVSSSQ